MSISVADIEGWILDSEDEHLEFKAARNQYNTEKLIKYCGALANEGGGKMLLGITDVKPRKIIGTNAFAELNSLKSKLIDKVGLYIQVHELEHPDGRVLVFDIPGRPAGMPISYQGAYYMRAGEDLVAMTPDRLQNIFNETGADYSAEVCANATFSDLDSSAIESLRTLWRRKSNNDAVDNLSQEQLLEDLELTIDGNVTYAALVLLGTERALGRYVQQAEVVFEYRGSEASTDHQQRREFRKGFFLFENEIWEMINVRNEVHHYEDGLFVGDIRTFENRVVREALLNAVSHRDYRLAGSTFVRQYPRKLEIRSPGGFTLGVTEDNILWKQVPRNRRIAEVLQKCGLVERSGQGARLMFERSIRESKARPSFSGTDEHEVVLTLRGEIQDPRFLDFFEKVGKETLETFSTQDFLVVDFIHKDQTIPEDFEGFLPRLLELGIVESQGRGKSKRHFLSRRFYSTLGKTGTYTRRLGLDKRTNKELLVKHIKDSKEEGARLEELAQVLPSLSRNSVQMLMKELKAEGRIHVVGRTRAARWHLGPPPENIRSEKEVDVNTRNTNVIHTQLQIGE